MPLRDHFHPPLSKRKPWDALHGQWPAMIVIDLNSRLPPRYVASPRIHLGTAFEIDVAASDTGDPAPFEPGHATPDGGGTAVWAPPEPTLAVATDLPVQDEYEVQIFDVEEGRLVAAIEIVSPANKDRPEHRRIFVSKCAAMLRAGVSVSIIDLVTSRRFNLYADLLELLGQTDRALEAGPSPVYAAACRCRERGRSWHLETWARPLEVGRPLPTLPLWLSPEFAVPLELESSYEQTCRILRVP